MRLLTNVAPIGSVWSAAFNAEFYERPRPRLKGGNPLVVFAGFRLYLGSTRAAYFHPHTGRKSDDSNVVAHRLDEKQRTQWIAATPLAQPYAEAGKAVMYRLTGVGPLLAYTHCIRP